MKRLTQALICFFIVVFASQNVSSKPFLDDSLRVEVKAGRQFIIHEVEEDETAYSICTRYNIAKQDFDAANPTKKGKPLKMGELVYIPLEKVQFKLQSSQGVGLKNVHIVQKGEWLNKIAQKHNVSKEQLREWNKLKGDLIVPGQELIVGISNKSTKKTNQNNANAQNKKDMVAGNYSNAKPVTKLKSAAPQEADSIKTSPFEGKLIEHTFIEGESLFELAQKYEVKINDIKRWNDLEDRFPKAGEVLDIYVDEDKYDAILDEMEKNNKKSTPALPTNNAQPTNTPNIPTTPANTNNSVLTKGTDNIPTTLKSNNTLAQQPSSSTTTPTLQVGTSTLVNNTPVQQNSSSTATAPVMQFGGTTLANNTPAQQTGTATTPVMQFGGTTLANNTPAQQTGTTTATVMQFGGTTLANNTPTPQVTNGGDYIIHEVVQDETLSKIRDLYNLQSVVDIMRWNGLSKAQSISLKQKIKIYKPTTEQYVVQANDNIQTLARKYPTIRQIEKRIVHWNKELLSSATDIKQGQTLTLHVPHPKGLPNEAERGFNAVENSEFYTIEEGDNLAAISNQFNVARSEVIRWNNLRPNTEGNYILHFGDRLKIYNPTLATYVVKQGDNIKSIENAFPTISKLDRKIIIWNKDKLNSLSDLKVGQVLKVYVPNPLGLKIEGSTNTPPLTSPFDDANNESNVATITNEQRANPQIPPQAKRKSIIHIVKPKETLFDIAQKYKVKVAQLKEWNELETNNYIQAGREIVVYVEETPEKKIENKPTNAASGNTNSNNTNNITTNNNLTKPNTNNNANVATKEIKHKVVKGESLSKIANDYGVKMADIKKKNNLITDGVFIGQTLTIEVPTSFEKGTTTANNQVNNNSKKVEIPKINPFVQNAQANNKAINPSSNGIVLNNTQGQGLYRGGSNATSVTTPNNNVGNPSQTQTNNSAATNIIVPPPIVNNTAKMTDSTKTNNAVSVINTPIISSGGNIVEKGKAEVLEDNPTQRRFVALHRSAPIGTLVLIKNTANGNSVVVQITANLPADASPSTIIKVSKAAWERLNTTQANLDVELNY